MVQRHSHFSIEPVMHDQRLDNAPIIEAIVDIDCDLPPSYNLRALEDAAHNPLREQYPVMQRRFMQEVRIEAGKEGSFDQQVRQDVDALQFLAPDRKQLVQFRLDGFSFNRLAPYSTLDDYKSDIRTGWQAFLDVVAPVQIRTVRLRYINRIMIPVTETHVDLNAYFRVAPSQPADPGLRLSSFVNQYTATDPETGHYSTVVLASQQREGGELPIIFDNTALSTRAIDPDDWTTLWNEIQAVRYLKNRVFYNTLEDKCLRLFSSD